MAGKRTRKDSERSVGSSEATSSNCSSTAAGPRGVESSSSGSIEDECESGIMKACCFPSGCLFGEDTMSEENTMVKVICSYDACEMSQFMHKECFNHWEEGILNCLRSCGRARNWSEKQRRQNLWTKKGYDLVYRVCVCKCKHGHLRKDLNWIAEPSLNSEHESSAGKKKNRKKHKDLPSLGGFSGLVRTKSRPIPNSKDHRIRHSSTSSVVSVDQGYLSASPATCELGPLMFSPPLQQHHHKPVFSFHNTHIQSLRGPNAFRMPSTSPLLEIPDDTNSVNPPFISPPVSTETSPTFPSAVFMSQLSPQQTLENETKGSYLNEIQRLFPKSSEEGNGRQNQMQAMSALIDNLWKQESTLNNLAKQHSHNLYTVMQNQNHVANDQQLEKLRLEQALAKLCLEQTLSNQDFHSNPPVLPKVPLSSLSMSAQHLEHDQHRNEMKNSWANITQQQSNDITAAREQQTFCSTNPMFLDQRQKEMEKSGMSKFILNVMSEVDNNKQVFTFPGSGSKHSSHTEVRLVPMKSTAFSKRYDFSSFQNVLPSKHINPYHIKMEGEGYGSDDLRNFILANLSKAKCAQVNCVVCGVDLPVYDHFPLVDGTMFLSPERNERSTKNCFKIKVDGKCEYVHAACMRCLEGLHNIVCRLCNTRWEGTHYQLGTLYMYDIFAALPCCQQRMACKKCGGTVVDIRQGLTYFSEYSLQKACPHCNTMDYHFVRPITTYQLIGLVFS